MALRVDTDSPLGQAILSGRVRTVGGGHTAEPASRAQGTRSPPEPTRESRPAPKRARRGTPEADHQRALVTYLTLLEAHGEILAFHVPNERGHTCRKCGERGGGIQRAVLAALGVRPGVVDMVLLFPGSRTAFLELKASGEKPTDDQRTFLEQVRAWGFQAEWSDNLERSIAIVDGWRGAR